MNDDEKLTAVERALIRALAHAIVVELRQEDAAKITSLVNDVRKDGARDE